MSISPNGIYNRKWWQIRATFHLMILRCPLSQLIKTSEQCKCIVPRIYWVVKQHRNGSDCPTNNGNNYQSDNSVNVCVCQYGRLIWIVFWLKGLCVQCVYVPSVPLTVVRICDSVLAGKIRVLLNVAKRFIIIIFQMFSIGFWRKCPKFWGARMFKDIHHNKSNQIDEENTYIEENLKIKPKYHWKEIEASFPEEDVISNRRKRD